MSKRQMLVVLVIFSLGSAAAFAQCVLSSPDKWSLGANGNWSVASNWSGGVPTGSSAVCITDGSSAVTLDTVSGSVKDLQLATGNSLNIGQGRNLYAYGTQILNNGQININGGAGTNAQLAPSRFNLTLSGTGTVTLTTTAAGGGTAMIEQAVGGLVLTNQSTIQGEGIIGNNGLGFANTATGIVNANSTGGPLTSNLYLQGISGPITNAGLFEASNSGILRIVSQTVNNAGGHITANNSGSRVEFSANTDIQGGTLTNNGGWMGTVTGYAATLDGTTNGPINLNGAYTSDYGSVTHLLGTINNNNTFQLKGGNGSNAYIQIGNNVTLQGGGTLNLSTLAAGGGYAYLDQASGGLTLTNVDNTIQGAAIIGNNGLSVINGVAATVLANALGQSLFINGGGSVTNNGTFQVNDGSTLHLANVAFTNFSANTLTGGTYNVYGTAGGTLQLDPLGSGGGEIVNNLATILLDGPNSNFFDRTSLDALSNFSNNTAAGSFTIQNGRNFTSPGSFANAGTVNVGSGSTFTTGGSGNYNQSGGNTKVDGALVAGGGQVNINGGTLLGNGGTITGTVNNNSNTVSPGDAAGTAGVLHIVGNYVQTAAGVFQLDIGGLNAGTQFDLLTVTQLATIGGTLDISLINSFTPNNGDIFTFLTSGGGVGGVFATVNGLNYGNGHFTVIYNSNNVELAFTGNQNTTPEPGTFLLLGSGLLTMVYGVRRRWQR